MTIEQIRKAYKREPFEPFAMFLADGRILPVPHQEFMYIAPKNERTVFVADDEGVVESVDLPRVGSIKPLTNGSRRGRAK